MAKPLVVGITGASGAIYAARLLHVLASHADRPVHITMSPAAVTVFKQELGVDLNLAAPSWEDLFPQRLAELPVAQRPPLVQHMVDFPDLWKLRTAGQGSGRSAAGEPAEAQPTEPSECSFTGFLYHRYQDYMAPIASGSFLTAGMVIVPCSTSTLGNIVHATGGNLVHRAADVHLKDRKSVV